MDLLRPLSWVAAILIAGCASRPAHNPHADLPEEQARIQRRLNEIFDAAEKKDLARLDSYHLYGPKFTKFGGESIDRQDAEAARKGEHDGLGGISGLSMQAQELKVDVFGDVGIATFILDYRFASGTNTLEKRARATLVFVKDRGAWKIVHEHFSPSTQGP